MLWPLWGLVGLDPQGVIRELPLAAQACRCPPTTHRTVPRTREHPTDPLFRAWRPRRGGFRLRRVSREEQALLGHSARYLPKLGSRGVLNGRSVAPASTLELPAEPPALRGEQRIADQ